MTESSSSSGNNLLVEPLELVALDVLSIRFGCFSSVIEKSISLQGTRDSENKCKGILGLGWTVAK